MAGHESTDIESILREHRKFEPPANFSDQAQVKSVAENEALCRRADEDPEGFWAECAPELDCFKPFGQVLGGKRPFAKWFLGCELNASYNCLDRHLKGARRN